MRLHRFAVYVSQIVMLLAWSFLAINAHAAESNQLHGASLFDEGTFLIHDAEHAVEAFAYRLFRPKSDASAVPPKKLPLLVWFHGHGPLEFSTTNRGQLLYVHECVFSQFERPSDCRCYILAVQCPSAVRPWFGSQGGAEGKPLIEPGEAVARIIDSLVATESVDPHRISLIGISSGGVATWEFAMRHPDVVSAIAPTAASGGDIKRINRMSAVPVWAFHNSNDSKFLRDGTLTTMASLQKSGGICWFTEVPGKDVDKHNAWREAFLDHGLFQWLVSQEKRQTKWQSQWKHWRHTWLNIGWLWPKSLSLLFVVVCLAVWRQYERSRRRFFLQLLDSSPGNSIQS